MSNYSDNTYIEDSNNSWAIVFKLVNPKELVLDIGCSSGNFGAQLIADKNCIVDGIDIDEADVRIAKNKLRKALVLNIETDKTNELTEKYDVVLMMDVIEHLVDPISSLKKIRKLLKPNGRLIFSVPNMAHVSVRLDLLLGKFEYRQIGLLDFTHLHFYTQDTLTKTLNNAGYVITNTKSSTVTYPKKLLSTKLQEAGVEAGPLFEKKLSQSKGNIYQLIGVAMSGKMANSRTAIDYPTTNPHEEHFKDIEHAMDIQQKDLELKDQHIKNLEVAMNNITSSKSYKLAHHLLKPYRKVQKSSQKKKKRTSQK